MIIINVKDGESIDRALRRYKKKSRQLNLIRQVRANRFFKKPSEIRKETFKKARHRQKMMDEIDAR